MLNLYSGKSMLREAVNNNSTSYGTCRLKGGMYKYYHNSNYY